MKKHVLRGSLTLLILVSAVSLFTAGKDLRADLDLLVADISFSADQGIEIDEEGSGKAGYSGFVPAGSSFRYYDPETGEYLTGLQTIEGNTYYFHPSSGVAVSGRQTIGGKAYYFDPVTFRMQTGIVAVTYSGGVIRKHYFLPEGGMASGWITEDGKTYYFSSPSAGAIMLTGKQSIGGKLYCFDEETGELLLGVAKANDGYYYYFDPESSGGYRTGLQEWNGELYFFLSEKSGIMDYGLEGVGKDLYYFDLKTGAAVKNQTINQGHILYTFGSDGKMTNVVAEDGFGSSKRAQLIIKALDLLGEPYALNMYDGYSCGYFVKCALAKIGISVPTSSDQQAKAVIVDHSIGKEITLDDLRVGDVFYWQLIGCGDSSCTHWNEIHHVAIYVGNGKALESVEHRGCVTIDNIREYDSGVSSYHIKYYVRYIDESGDPYVDENKEVKDPTNLQAVWNDSEGLVHLTWEHEGPADGFYVYYTVPGGSVLVKNITDGTARSLDTDFVKWGFTMTYGIEAYRTESGVVSGASTATVDIPDVPAPDDLTAVFTDGDPNSATASWEYNLPVDGFYITLIDLYGNTDVENITAGKNTRSVTFQNLEYNKTYVINVKPYRLWGSSEVSTSYVSTYLFVPEPVCEDPTNVTATFTGINDFTTLTWSYTSSLVNGFYIYRDGALIATLTNKATRTYKDLTIAYGKTYKYEVEAFRTIGSDTVSSAKVPFTITVPNIAPPAVTELKAQAAGKYKVTLTWNKSTGAEGYLIYAQKKGSYGYVGMTTMGTTYTDKNALGDDYNFYWVFPYIKNASGKMVPGGCTKYVFAKGICAAVTNLKAASVKGGLKLTWTASPDAEGYLIYGIVDGKPYGYIGMTTQGTTFTDKNASTEKFNYYWVYPYFKDAEGNMIVGLTGKYTYGRALPPN